MAYKDPEKAKAYQAEYYRRTRGAKSPERQKPIKLTPKRNGAGCVTSYTFNIGISEARAAGLIDADGTPAQLEKFVDEPGQQIIIRPQK